jgi:hypothetical protein
MIQHFLVGRLVAENGQIKLLRESVNLVNCFGIYPNGLAGYIVPTKRKNSQPMRY